MLNNQKSVNNLPKAELCGHAARQNQFVCTQHTHEQQTQSGHMLK